MDSIGGIKNCIEIVGKWNFGRNFPFAISLNFEALDYWCNDHNQEKGINGYKELCKSVRSFTTEKLFLFINKSN